ncbi:hypothetical protein GV794_12905 [Nocardia cyriacigeorgica]|uniref:Uncharacterized protein n=1 Tax=Nocardia cyriacigeorgica TaxID=135487 RepID=A0A6P1D0Y4_9NOCA|nr:hypothetical protein [Nocardia cyriacigeorgica]NEW39583.1 hypothetical protein [Nocardia cyriacigeorgica]NEW43997.1 hypothetical protein [Nocardia cyriacigeorgica]NEW50072.1 hypothetical protein [Nocardia cyriacigeorgica]NEW56545.1 hypothetical protein [Nocardia cyriacigeorgica]
MSDAAVERNRIALVLGTDLFSGAALQPAYGAGVPIRGRGRAAERGVAETMNTRI